MVEKTHDELERIVENNGDLTESHEFIDIDLYEFCKSKTSYSEYGKITLVEYVEEIFNEHKDLKRENEKLKNKIEELESEIENG